MLTFTTTIKLTNSQAKKLILSIGLDVNSYHLVQLFTLPLGSTVEKDVDRSGEVDIVHISFGCRKVSGKETWTTIRIPENIYFVMEDIVDQFLYAKNFADFKLHVWHLSAHIIGNTIRVNDEIIAQCAICDTPQYTKFMVESILNSTDSEASKCKKTAYEYLCDGCVEVCIPDSEPSHQSCYTADIPSEDGLPF